MINEVFSTVSSREWAALIWLTAAFAFCATNPSIRPSLAGVISAIFQPKIIGPLTIAAAYAALEVLLLIQIGWWSVANLKTTILWILTFAFVAMFEVANSRAGKTNIRSVARDTISVTAVFVFVTELHSFPLIVELIALPVVSFVILMVKLAKARVEHQRLIGPLTTVVGVIATGYFIYSIFMTYRNWSESADWSTALEFFVPIILSFGFLPFLWLWSAFVTYDGAFIRLKVRGIDETLQRHARWLAVRRIRGDTELLQRWLNVVGVERPSNKTELKKTLEKLRAVAAIENAPPIVLAEEGWSPYVAKNYLNELGYQTGYYQESDWGWYASSPMKETGDGFTRNNIAYYVEGNEKSATTLKLKLNVNDPEAALEDEETFIQCCLNLLSEAVSDNAARRIRPSIATLANFSAEIPFGTVSMSRDVFIGGTKGGYSLRFEIKRGFNREK